MERITRFLGRLLGAATVGLDWLEERPGLARAIGAAALAILVGLFWPLAGVFIAIVAVGAWAFLSWRDQWRGGPE